MKKGYILVMISLFSFFKTFSQVPNLIKAWEKVYGGESREYTISLGQKIFMTSNNSFVIVVDGSKSSDSGNKNDNNCNANDDAWVIKINGDGNKIFDKTLGGDSTDLARGSFINSKNQIAICGFSRSDSSCEKSQNSYGGTSDAWIVVIDTNGNYQWDKRYGWMGSEEGRTMVNLTNGDYLLAGYDHIPAAVLGGDVTDSTNGFEDYWIIKMDSLGNKIWDHTYGGWSGDFPNFALEGNNSYFFGGVTSSDLATGDLSTPTFGYPLIGGPLDGWLIKTDTVGNKIWDKRYGGNDADGIGGGILLNDGTILIAAGVKNNASSGNVSDTNGRGQSDIWLVKIDTANGNIINDKRYGGNRNDGVCSVVPTSDGGFLICATSNSDIGFEKSEANRDTSGFHWYDWWLIKVDSNLNKVWDKTLGGSGSEDCPSVVFIDDSTFIIEGTSGSDISGDKTLAMFDTVAPQYARGDVWAMKFIISTATGIDEINSTPFTIYPNPVKDMLYVSSKKSLPANSSISIIDMQGRVIKEEKILHSNSSVIPIDVGALSQGVYLLKLNGRVQRFVKM